MEDTICIIPARGGSKRFPRKNIVSFAGKPLLAHAIEAGRESGVFDTVCVSSDDQEILSVAKKWEADLIRERPAHLANDDAQVKDVCRYILEDLHSEGEAYSSFGILLTTNPLRTAEDIQEAYRRFLSSNAEFLLSVVPFRHPPQRAFRVVQGQAEPVFGTDKMLQTQKLETMYRHDGAILFGDVDTFLSDGSFYRSDIAAYEMPADRSIDIDEPLDLEWARFLLERQQADGGHARDS